MVDKRRIGLDWTEIFPYKVERDTKARGLCELVPSAVFRVIIALYMPISSIVRKCTCGI